MKLRLSKRRNRAWTITDLTVVIIAVMVLLAAMLLPVLEAAKRRSLRTTCLNNLKIVNESFRVWPDAQDNTYPMSVSVTRGGAMETLAEGNLASCFQVMSNELDTPKVLVCPADIGRIPATSFRTNFSNANISYFINPDASESYPQQIMTGDANLATNGVAVKSGLLEFPASAPMSFTAARHRFVGNIGYADGSVAEVSNAGLQSSLILATNGTPFRVNRFAIP